jgi:hypothetical protein
MHQLRHQVVLTLALIFLAPSAYTQLLKGTIIDKKSNETIPFSSVYLQISTATVSTDLDGNFSLPFDKDFDTLIISSMGYGAYKQLVYKHEIDKPLIIYLEEEGVVLEETVVRLGEDPALAIIRKVIKNKKNNDPERALAINYQKYSKLEVDIDNISAKFKEKKMLKNIGEDLETLELLKDSLGNEYIPFFITESVSEIYRTRKPFREKEVVLGTKMHGIGMDDAKFWNQFTGTYFTGYNFYNDMISVIDKEFHSPITDSWKSYYDYYLMDSLYVDERKVYKIDVEPKRKYDLAFTGTIWIYDSTFALQAIKLKLLETANLNYIENIHIKMDWQEIDSSKYWLNTSYLCFDMSEVSDTWAGLTGKIFNKYSKVQKNAPEDPKFYRELREVADDSEVKDTTFWKVNSPKSGSYENDQEAIALINSVKELPSVKSYIDILEFLFAGYQPIGKFDIGPYVTTYAYNNIEGHRLRLGGKTNKMFSEKIQFSGYLAYGTEDNQWKYSLGTQYYISKKQWSYVGLRHRKDLDQLGITGRLETPFFEALAKWGNQKGAYYREETEAYFFRQLNKNFSTNINVTNYTMDPVFDYSSTIEGETSDVINTTEIGINLHIGYREKFIIDDFNRLSLGSKIPLLDLKYTAGLSDFFGSNYNYHKLDFKLEHTYPLGNLGKSKVWIYGGKVFNTLPYPLLNITIGNETIIYGWFSFNVMNYFEFVSDQYASITYVHHFNGFLLNRIPLMKKMKWRTVVNFSALKGSVKQENIDAIPEDQRVFTTFQQEPYMEVGYGIENIFKVLRVQAFHRLTYRENPGATLFGIKGTLQFSF